MEEDGTINEVFTNIDTSFSKLMGTIDRLEDNFKDHLIDQEEKTKTLLSMMKTNKKDDDYEDKLPFLCDMEVGCLDGYE